MQKSSGGWLSWVLPGCVLLMGIGISLGLQIYTRDGVFFSGDAGLKALLAQQLSTGQWRMALDIPQPPWVMTLWQQGLYPFTPPYVYLQQGNYFITFPFTFPAITAPFYALAGYHGLYVVPLVSLWVVWGRVWQVCRVWQVPSRITALSLALVILASPLTLYGAMYWEHTLAVALAFWGLSGLTLHALPEGQSHRISLNQALINGVCVGLSVWFRPEFLCLAASLVLVLLASLVPAHRLPNPWRSVLLSGLSRGVVVAFVGAMVATMAGFFGLNLVVYGHPLGIHSIQIVEESSLAQQIAQARANYRQLGLSLVRYFPAVVLGLGLPWLVRGRARSAGTVLWWVGVLFAIAVPLIVPPGAGGKQWGPRFYLILMPMVGLIVAAGLPYLWQFRRRRWGALTALVLVMVLGFYTNIISGGFHSYRDRQTNSISLPSNYLPIAPAIAALGRYDGPWVAMSHQFVAQQLWPSARLKTFFRTETEDAVKQLAVELVNQGEFNFLYVCYPHSPCPIPTQGRLTVASADGNTGDGAMSISFEALGTFGKYPFYRGSVQTGQ